VYVELAAEGRARLPRMHRISMEVLDQFLHGFGGREVRRLETYLARLLLNAQTPFGVSDMTYRIVFEILASDS
jgi:DNA-binding MarR family transcriptional regulator